MECDEFAGVPGDRFEQSARFVHRPARGLFARHFPYSTGGGYEIRKSLRVKTKILVNRHISALIRCYEQIGASGAYSCIRVSREI